MTRTVLAAFAALALAAPPAHAAAPAPQVTDARADWYVDGQDVLSGRVSSALVHGVPHLRGELRLAAPPATGAAATYQLRFVLDCRAYAFVYEWRGSPGVAVAATFDKWDYCHDAPDPLAGPEERHAATFAVRGTVLTWQVPYLAGIRRGQRVTRFSMQACASMCGLDTDLGPPVGLVGVVLGDWARNARGAYVVGSDLPRR